MPRLTSAEASEIRGGNSIAAHVAHVVFAMDAASNFIEGVVRGEMVRANWDQSWVTSTVSDDQWESLSADVRKAHDRLVATIREHATHSFPTIGVSHGSAAHVAYHLGAIRQKLRL